MKIKCKSEEEKSKIIDRDCPFEYDPSLLYALEMCCSEMECGECFKVCDIEFEVEE